MTQKKVFTMPNNVAIGVHDVTKFFSLRANHSLKEFFVSKFTKSNRTRPTSHFVALDDVSFDIKAGETVGIIGINGSGKSTMLKLISGVMQPDTGNVLVRGRIAGLIEVGAGFSGELTGRENVYLNGAILGMSKEEIDERYDDIVAFSEIPNFMDTEVRFYSSGMFLRLAFAVAAYSNPDIFLIDEILAVGDEAFQKKCINRLKELNARGQTMVIVSHSEDQIKKLCNRCIVLSHSKLVYDGNPDIAFQKMRTSALDQDEPEELTSTPLEGTTKIHEYWDVAQTDWAYDSIQWITTAGITSGVGPFPDGHWEFRPNDLINRRSLAVFLYRFVGSPKYTPPEIPSYTDVDSSDWAYKYIEWAHSNRLIPENSASLIDLSYSPEDTVDRGTMASTLYNLVAPYQQEYKSTGKTFFADISDSDKDSEAIQWLISSGIASGIQHKDGKTYFESSTSIDRRSTAVFLYRMYMKKLLPPQSGQRYTSPSAAR